MGTRDCPRGGIALLVAAVVACAMGIAVPHAGAFTILQTDCGGDRFRDPGGWPVIEMCLNPPGFPGMTSATDPNGNTFTAARGGMLSGHWMWVREATSDASLFVDTGAGCGNGDGFGWFDNANEKNNVWWESTATVGTRCSGAVGCTATDEAFCIPLFNESTHIIAADIVISNQAAYTVVNQDTLVDCFRTGTNHETLWLHEIGHAYGIGHEQAAVSVMRGAIGGLMRNCHVAQGFHNYPFPDDIAGLMKHHKGFSGTKRNWAGTPWIRDAGVDSVPDSTINVTSNSVFVGVQATVHKYYSAGGWPTSRLFLVPISSTPTFNHNTKVWTLNATQFGSIINHSSDGTPTFGIESRTVNLGATLGGASLPVGSYRVWAQLDVTGTTTETDEGDNVFPTNIKFNRN